MPQTTVRPPGRTLSETSLDTRPTSDFDPHANHISREFVHSGSVLSTDQWREAIAYQPLSLKHLTRYDACGENAWIQTHVVTGQCRVVFDRCKLRCCPVCCKIAARRVKQRLETALLGAKKHKWRLITLTLKATNEPLDQRITTLKRAFRRLRQDERWKQHVHGGYAVLEITWNSESGHWHPHFHIVCDGCYFDWRMLRAAWQHASGGATVTDIRSIKRTSGAIHYLTHYLGKIGHGLSGCCVERRNEYYRTIQGLRFLISFGAVPAPAKDQPRDVDAGCWTNVAPVWQFVIALRDGLTWALALSRKLHNKPLEELAIADWHPPPQLPIPVR